MLCPLGQGMPVAAFVGTAVADGRFAADSDNDADVVLPGYRGVAAMPEAPRPGPPTGADAQPATRAQGSDEPSINGTRFGRHGETCCFRKCAGVGGFG